MEEKRKQLEEKIEDSGIEEKRKKLEEESNYPEKELKEKKRKLLEEHMIIEVELLKIKTIKNAAIIQQNKLLAIERNKRAPEKKAFELLNDLKILYCVQREYYRSRRRGCEQPARDISGSGCLFS
jgi:hypothetical protein